MEKEHVVETAIRAKCEEEDWEYDSISTFSRVTFVYLSMRPPEQRERLQQAVNEVTD